VIVSVSSKPERWLPLESNNALMSDGRTMAVEQPWLSVIVPCRNGERWLAAALQSVVHQKDKGIEVIVIDGSATNASLEIVKSFSDRLLIRAQHRPDLLSWTAKTNFGIEQAQGDRICMLHVDDLWLPNRCAEIRKWLSTQSDGVMHLHPSYIIDDSGRRLGLWRCPLPAGDFPVPTHILIERLLVQNFIGIPSPTIRRDAYLSVGGLDNDLWYTADWDLYLKLAAIGSVYYHSSPLACFRVHKNSLTVSGSRNSADFRNQHQAIVDRHADKLSPEARAEILPIAAASFDLNTALAAVMIGQFGQIGKALVSVLMLGPRRIHKFFSYSRIAERIFPRLRALVSGRF
jgi:glycosyltransferase involved in cell wall biosynthesis